MTVFTDTVTAKLLCHQHSLSLTPHALHTNCAILQMSQHYATSTTLSVDMLVTYFVRPRQFMENTEEVQLLKFPPSKA